MLLSDVKVIKEERPQRFFYGRRQSRPLRPETRALVDKVWGKYVLTPDMLPTFFSYNQPLTLEIGFGRGDHLVKRALENPSKKFIGCEMFMNGLAFLVTMMEGSKIVNTRFIQQEAQKVLPLIPAESLERIYILFPDPWPKPRHHKRRLIQEPFLKEVVRCLQPGGELVMATDDPGYLKWILACIGRFQRFQLCQENIFVRPFGWIPTPYEQKALAGKPAYLIYRKV